MKKEIIGQAKNMGLIDVAAKNNLSVLLVGDTGSGKTSMVQAKAQELGKTSIRFNLTGETTVDEFVGKYVLQNGETVWQDGILLKAMKEGWWLIVDEINAALPEILFVLHSLLDDDKCVVVTNHESEVVKPHKDFRFFATMNPVDEYAGTKDLNKAFKSRFQMILNVDYPDAQTEAAIIVHHTGIKDEEATKMVLLAQGIREAKKKEEVFYTCSTRDLIQWATLSKTIGVGDAFHVTIMNKANGDGKKLADLYTRHVEKLVEFEKRGIPLSFRGIEEGWTALKTAQAEFEKYKETLAYQIAQNFVQAYLEKTKLKV